jgi:hypothetical protein
LALKLVFQPLYLQKINQIQVPSDHHYLLLIALVFFPILPELLPAQICSTSNVCHDKILGKVLLPIHLDVAR